MRRKLTIAILVIAALAMSIHAQQELGLGQVLTGLTTQGKTPETNTLAKRNIYIAGKVKLYGVSFVLTPDFEKELRKAGATTVLIETIRRYGPANTTTPRTSVTPNATFSNVRIDYDQTKDGVKGMIFHVKFSANQMKGLPSYVAIYFIDEDGTFLKDNNGKMRSSSGEVAVYRELDPCCPVTDYEDLDIFMPYGELDLPDGEFTLKADIKVIYKAGGLISALTQKAFTYSQKPKVDPKGTMKKVWIEYNVKEGGRNGMRVHANFEVSGLLGIDSRLIYRIAKEDNTFVSGSSSEYLNDDGDFRTFFDMKPGYDPASFTDAKVFIPYDEISISRGKWNLHIDIDLAYENDGVIAHMHNEPFTFTQK